MDKPRGALVASVAQNSPSEKAGVKAGDIILEFNGEVIGEMKELPIIVARTEVGKKVKVKIWRNKKEIIKDITLGRLETSEDFKVAEKEKPQTELAIEGLKISVRELTKEDIKTRNLPNQTSGLVITKIEKDSPLINSIEKNSIILEAQKKKIRTAKDLNVPLMRINHLEAHVLMARIENYQQQERVISGGDNDNSNNDTNSNNNNLKYPFLVLLVSGGHCMLLVAKGIGRFETLGATLDDSIGEAFDKVARFLGLGFNENGGGPAIEKLAIEFLGDHKFIDARIKNQIILND